MKQRIIIRADGGTNIGMGHVVRCIALADMLKNSFDIIFSIQQPTITTTNLILQSVKHIIELPLTEDYRVDALNFSQLITSTDIVVLDGYHFKTEYQKVVKDIGCKLVCIDDLHAWHQMADIIINQADDISSDQYSAEPYTKFCLGLNFALLRTTFLQTDTGVCKKISFIKKAFISMGAADVNNNSGKFIQALRSFNEIVEIHVMLSEFNPHHESIQKTIQENNSLKIIAHYNITAEKLSSLLKICDICICPASTISLEACAIGVGLITGYTANNQLSILNGLVKNRTAINWGDFNKLNISDLHTHFKSIMASPALLNELIQNQQKIIDGKSPERILKIFNSLVSKNIHYRYAIKSDVDQYYKWANDASVRSNSFNQTVIEYCNHVSWFYSKVDSKNCFLYIFFNEFNSPVGQIRIDNDSNGEVVIGISIDEAHRGKLFGEEMLNQATTNFLEKNPNQTIIAYIKVENTASYIIFKKAGFTNEIKEIKEGYHCYKLYKC